MDSSKWCSSNQIAISFYRKSEQHHIKKLKSTILTRTQILEPEGTYSKPDRVGYQILVSDILDDPLNAMIKR